MAFDPTITFGAMLNAAAIIVGFVVAFTRVGGRIDLLAARLTSVEEAIREARDIDSRLATQEERYNNVSERLNTHARDISDLRRGRGFIQEEIDGEYPRKGPR